MADYIRALKIAPDGRCRVVALPTGDAQLDAMHDVIECGKVEPVNLGTDVTMWADEVGFAADPPVVNLMATGIAARYGLTRQPYVGNVLFTGGMDGDGENLGLTVEQADELRATAESVIRVVVAYRMSYPTDTAMDEARAVQDEFAPENGLSR